MVIVNSYKEIAQTFKCLANIFEALANNMPAAIRPMERKDPLKQITSRVGRGRALFLKQCQLKYPDDKEFYEKWWEELPKEIKIRYGRMARLMRKGRGQVNECGR